MALRSSVHRMALIAFSAFLITNVLAARKQPVAAHDGPSGEIDQGSKVEWQSIDFDIANLDTVKIVPVIDGMGTRLRVIHGQFRPGCSLKGNGGQGNQPELYLQVFYPGAGKLYDNRIKVFDAGSGNQPPVPSRIGSYVTSTPLPKPLQAGTKVRLSLLAGCF